MQAALGSPVVRRRALLWLGSILLALAALWLASRIPRTLTVFVIAAFIAFGVAPILRQLERRMPRPWAILVIYAALVAFIIVLALLVVPATLGQIQAIGADAPAYVAASQNWIDATQRFMAEHFGKSYLPPGYGDLRGFLAARASVALTSLLSSLTGILIGTFTAAFIGISALVLSAFFLMRGDTVADSFYALLPKRRRPTARALGVELANVFGSYVAGQAALCGITGAFIFALTLAAGFKFALLLGLISGLAYAVPFVGMLVAQVIGLVLAAPQGPQTVIWVQVIMFTVARISDNLLVPKVMSDSVGVSPIVVMFATFAGGELFGLPGLLLGIPVAALAKVAWRFFRAQRDESERRETEAAPAVAERAETTVVVEPVVVAPIVIER
jgi:predicted PurR-regulated permease PerM